MNMNDEIDANDDPLCSPQEVGQRLAIARDLRGISREVMALGLRTTSELIEQVEQGKRLMPDSWLALLAVIFNIDSRWVATGVRPLSAKTLEALDEMETLMQVPEVNEYITNQFQLMKTIFKEQIKKRIIPVRNT